MVDANSLKGSVAAARERLHKAVGNGVDLIYSEDKGRSLVARRSYKAGEVIFREKPLLTVASDTTNPVWHVVQDCLSSGSLDVIWYWTALCSLLTTDMEIVHPVLRAILENIDLPRVSRAEQEQLELFFVPSFRHPSSDVKAICRRLQDAVIPEVLVSDDDLVDEFQRVFDPMRVEMFLQTWVHNCFEYSESPLSYVAYAQSVYSSHSCLPNAVWYFDDKDPSLFTLSARFDVRPGDEICISYLSEDSLFEPTPLRRKWLHETKGFYCHCQRCSAHTDLSRGVKCPQCADGIVFLAPNDGDPTFASTRPRAESPDPKMSRALRGDRLLVKPRLPLVHTFNEDLLNDYINCLPARECLRCHHTVAGEELTRLIAIEKRMIQFIKTLTHAEMDSESWENLTVDEAALVLEEEMPGQNLIAFETKISDVSMFVSANEDRKAADAYIDRHFPMHWIRVAWKDKEVEFYNQYKMREEALRSMESVTSLLYRIYPSLSGTLGWHLESMADASLQVYGLSAKSIGNNHLSANQKAALTESGAVELYRASYQILSTLFGQKHKEYLAVAAKLKSAERALGTV